MSVPVAGPHRASGTRAPGAASLGHGRHGGRRRRPPLGGPVTRRRIGALVVVAVLIGVAVVTGLLLSGGLAPVRSPVRLAADPYAHAPGATTLVGTGSPGFAGDGQPAADAELDAPTGVVEDRSGDLFIADTDNCRVREVPARSGTSFGVRVRAGHIVTIAGGPCSDPTRNPEPVALALDPAGDLFIAFGSAARVEELPATGTPTTLAGTGVAGFAGDEGCSPTEPARRSHRFGGGCSRRSPHRRHRELPGAPGGRLGRHPVRGTRGPGGHLHRGRQRDLRVGRRRRSGHRRRGLGPGRPGPRRLPGTSSWPTRGTGPSGSWRPGPAPSTACPSPPVTWARWPATGPTAPTWSTACPLRASPPSSTSRPPSPSTAAATSTSPTAPCTPSGSSPPSPPPCSANRRRPATCTRRPVP